MTLAEQQSNKRKLHDYVEDDELVSSVSSRMRTSSDNNPIIIQFFVRSISGGPTLVLRGNPYDTIEVIHRKIQSATGIPLMYQRLIYAGRQLHSDHTLLNSRITNDSCLHLVSRMRSTPHPHAWKLLDGLLSLISRACRRGPDLQLDSFIKTKLTDFLNITMPSTDDTDDHNYDQDHDHAPYLDIFLYSSAPAALVMLYLSPLTGNKECALESIQHFIRSLPRPPIYSDFAPILLEFCKLLRTAVSHNDPLYKLCRATLGSMLLPNTTHNIALQEIFPFVNELATKLSQDLVSSMANPTGPLPSNVHDFGAFLSPLRNAILGHGTPLPVEYNLNLNLNLNPWYSYLHTTFLDLLAKVQACLDKVEEHIKVRKEKGDGGWDQYLCILKELHHIAVLYQGAEDKFWMTLSSNRVSICYLIVRYAKRGEDHKWILERKELTDFASRRHLVMMLLPEVKDDYEELHEMLIDRSQLLAESFEYIEGAEPGALRSGLFMEFKNEEATGPGVLREWFFLVCQAIFDPQNALFLVCPNDRRRFFPNPASKVDPMHLRYFKFSGRVIALALMHKMQVGIVFDRAFFLQLGGVDVCLEDIKDADPYLYSSCKQILDMDACAVDEDALGLTFVWEVEELGSKKVLELVPDGKLISVNSRNRKEYVDLLVKHRFVTSVAQQVTEFARGFADIVTSEEIRKLCFKSLVLEDLDGMLHGSESPISVDDWKAHTEYNGYKCTDPQIHWFWKIVGEMTAEQRKVLLFFWTSVKYLPVEGFCGLASRLYIYKSGECDRLPSSHTCFFRICFPAYPSMAVMQQRLNIITQQHVACSFGTW